MDIDHDPLTATLLRLALVQEAHGALLETIISQQAAHARALESLTRRLDDGDVLPAVSGALRDLVEAQTSQGNAILNLMGDVRVVMRAVGAEIPSRWGKPVMMPAAPARTQVAEGHPTVKALAVSAPTAARGAGLQQPITPTPAKTEPNGVSVAGLKPTHTLPTQPAPPTPLIPAVTPQPKSLATATPKAGTVAPTSSPKTTASPLSVQLATPLSTSNSTSSEPTSIPKPAPVPKSIPKPAHSPARPILRAEPPYCAAWNEGNCLDDPRACPLVHGCFACAAVGRPSKHKYHPGRCLKGKKW